MKTIEFRRHSIKDGTGGYMLGSHGYAFARRVGEKQLRGRGFTHFFVSTLWRTHQTLAAFAEGAGDFDIKRVPEFDPFFEISGKEEDAIALWHGACRTAEMAGLDMMSESLQYEKTRVDNVARLVVDAFRPWLAGLPDGANVLMVGHSPLSEFVPYGLFGVVLPGLRECNGFRLIEDGAGLRLDATSADLDAQPLR
ncbi:phosphoglycerate mutase family protein [bacterium]|nr:phosphoglycerate mutase family protein [bacterium]